MSPQETISRAELVRRIRAWERAVDSGADEVPDCPSLAVIDGKRMRYVAVGWVDEGPPQGNEPLVVE